jgi:phage shock protein C
MQDEPITEASFQEPIINETPPPGPDRQLVTGPRRLMRSRNDRVISGVAGGMAHYFGIDPTLMRFAWIVLSLAGGTGVLLYILAWIIIPEAPAGEELIAPAAAASSTGRYIIGGALIVLGGLFLLQRIIPRIFSDDIFWAVLLILIGVFVVMKGARR